MEHLTVILKKGQSFLLPCFEGSQRAVCPNAKTLCFLDNHCHLQLHSLQLGVSTTVDSATFTRFEWVGNGSGEGCVMEQEALNSSHLLALTQDCQLVWYSVTASGEGVGVQQLALLPRTDLHSLLREAKYSETVHSLTTIGSANHTVLVLVNQSLIVGVSLDRDFSRLSLNKLLLLAPSTQPFRDTSLPDLVGGVVSLSFVTPLLFALTQDGLIFVYNLWSSECVGVVSTVSYCQYQCSRQADSEELLSAVSCGRFNTVSVSGDLTQLVAATEDNHLVLVHLPDYYQMFPGHYHPGFRRSCREAQRSGLIAEVHQSTVEQEEERDRLKYGGLTDRGQSVSYLGDYVGHHAHSSRLKQLEQLVEGSQSNSLSFHGVSSLKSATPHEVKRNRLLRIPGVSQAVSTNTDIRPLGNVNKPWFLEPLVQDADTRSNWNVRLISSLSKSKPPNTKPQQKLPTVEKSHYSYACILPSPPMNNKTLVRSEFNSGLVTCYYGDVENKQEVGVILGGADIKADTLVVYHTDSQRYSVSNMAQPSWLLPSSTDQLLYLVSASTMAVSTFSLSQEELIGKVLMYGSAMVAEDLCHLNHWDKCSLPVNALETALELRQLDTLAFFLRSRESSDGYSGEEEGGHVTQDVPTLPPLPPEQLDTVIKLLIGAIRRNYVEETHCQFASQLLLMTLGFLTQVIKTQVLLDEEGETVSQTELTHYVEQLRTFLPKADKRAPGVDEVLKSGGVGPLSFLDQSLTKAWDRLPTKEVVKDALLKACLPLAQTYLLYTRKQNEKPNGRGLSLSLSEAVDDGSGPRYNSSLAHTLRIASGHVLEALDRRDLSTASALLVGMGCDERASLKHIFLHTVSRRLRGFLADHVRSNKWLDETELKALDYLHTLEEFYPVQSYDHAHFTYARQHPRKSVVTSTALPVMPGIVSRPTPIPTVGDLQDVHPETFGGEYPLSRDPSPQAGQSGPYLQVSLDLVLSWDTPTRERLLFEGMVLCSKTEESVESREGVVFEYHCLRGDLRRAVGVVMSSVPPLENQSSCPDHVVELCSQLPHSTAYLTNTLRNELASHGVFVPEDLKDLPSLLYRIGQTHSLFTEPHPLSKLPGSCDQSHDQDEAVISLDAFHTGFLKYLVENRFYSLMYHYLDHYSLALDEGSISQLGLDLPGEPWVKVLLQYRRAAVHDTDPDVMFAASLSCSNLLLSSGGGEPITVMAMLSSGRVLMAVASLMFAPAPLEEVMDSSNSSEPWYVEPGALARAVAAYPSLQAALFPPPPTALSPAHSQDISVYQLLQGSVPFNITKLFKWQSYKRSSHEEGSHVLRELPHFSSPALIEKFAFVEHLSYLYYLRRGQPSFAFANFVAAKLIGHSNTGKRLDHAVARVYREAILDFSNSKLVSSCVAFVEMCNKDSSAIRVDSQAALRMARHSTLDQDAVKEESAVESNKLHPIAAQFVSLQRCPDNKNIASSLLGKLEAATSNMVKSGGVELSGLESEECWSLVQSFCVCHSLPPSLGFITACAREGQWLPLLCHSQLHNIQPHKVLMVVDKHFSDSSLREHLHLAVSAMVPHSSSPDNNNEKARHRRRRGSPTKFKGQQSETLVNAKRDLRAKFYSRVGLQARGSTPQTQDSTPQTERRVSVETTPPVEPVTAVEESELPSDLFSVLLKCQSDKVPWRALLAHSLALGRPLLALLAACFQESNLVSCLSVWLLSSLGSTVMATTAQLLGIEVEDQSSCDLRFSPELQWRDWNCADLALLLVSAMRAEPSPVAVFTQGLTYLATPTSCDPLLHWIMFQEQFVLRSDYSQAAKSLGQFNLARDNAMIHGAELPIGDLDWIDSLVAVMASHMLVRCPTQFERSQLLRLLSEAEFGKDFTRSVLNYSELWRLSEVLSEAGLDCEAAYTLTEHWTPSPPATSLAEVYSVEVEIHSEQVLALLLQKELFALARRFSSTVLKNDSKLISITQAEHNLKKLSKSSYWRYEQVRMKFYYQCDTIFETESVPPELAAKFFEAVVHGQFESNSTPGSREATPTDPTPCSALERARLLAFSHKYRLKGRDQLSEEDTRDLEREIWKSHIEATREKLDSSASSVSGSSPLPFLPEMSDLALDSAHYSTHHSSLLSSLSVTAESEFKGRRRLSELSLSENVPVKLEESVQSRLSQKEGQVFDLLLSRLLNAGHINQARQLSQLFGHDSPSLTITLTCIKLAGGQLKPEQLTQDVVNLVSSRAPLSRQLSDTLLDPGHSRPSSEVLRIMASLAERALCSEIIYSITTLFKIAVLLKVPYYSIVSSDELSTLTKILSRDSQESYSLAGKFVQQVCKLESNLVSKYLADGITSALCSKSSDSPSAKSAAAIYHPHTSSREFQELIGHVVSDHTSLGNHLLERARSLVTHHSQDFSAPVELLIRAHDCYSFGGCSVAGVGEVLVLSRQWVDSLHKAKEYSLMVRLLTGISRYNEMRYIIGKLIEADQFEQLLSSGVEKEELLKLALLDYLRNHGNDPEKIQMVALKYGMFRELAKTKETQAAQEIKNMKQKQLSANNPDTVKRLRGAYNNYISAAKTYAQQDVLSKADQCSKQGRLIALQLSVLQQRRQLINLSARAVLQFLDEQPFPEALIVSEAYKHTIRTDWSTVLYKKIIKRGDFNYLSAYKASYSLTVNQVQDIVHRFSREKQKTPDMTNNVRKLLTQHLKNLPLRKRLFAQLGFKDTNVSVFDEGFIDNISRL